MIESTTAASTHQWVCVCCWGGGGGRVGERERERGGGGRTKLIRISTVCKHYCNRPSPVRPSEMEERM